MSVYLARAVNGRSPAFWSLAAVKAALVGALLLPALYPSWQQYADKGMHWRVLVFPLAGLLLPVLWRTTARRTPYPYLADGLVVLVPLTDALWNTLDAYDRIWWWDDLNHLVNSIVIAAAIGLWLRRFALASAAGFSLVFGIGMALAVGWELAEYASLAAGASEPQTYGDTIGDLTLAVVGTALAAAVAARFTTANPAVDPCEPEPALALSRL
jgi:glycopeptide antibiotics resistance protein